MKRPPATPTACRLSPTPMLRSPRRRLPRERCHRLLHYITPTQCYGVRAIQQRYSAPECRCRSAREVRGV